MRRGKSKALKVRHEDKEKDETGGRGRGEVRMKEGERQGKGECGEGKEGRFYMERRRER